MKHLMLYFSLIIATILLYLPGTQAKGVYINTDQQQKLIFGFENPGEFEYWRIVNDGVMGGLSKSKFIFNKNNTAVFKGTVSLENNGGFSSIRTFAGSYELDGYDGILLRVKGDGKKYQFRLRTNDRFDGISYRYQFETEVKNWIIIQIPFNDCEPVFRGRILENVEPIIPEKIQQIGFLISNKKAEQFQLEIDWIKGYKK